MSDLWVPAAEQTRRNEAVRDHTARLLEQAEMTEQVRYFNRELKKIDPYVEVIKAPANASYPGLTPGFWHILRRPPVGHPTLIAHQTPDGGYRDLDSGIFQTLRDGDMWSDARQRDREKHIRQAKQAEERQAEREREERVEELAERVKARVNPSVLMPRSI